MSRLHLNPPGPGKLGCNRLACAHSAIIAFMRTRFLLLPLCLAATPLAGVVAYRHACTRHEAAFQARFQQLRHDAHAGLRIGMTRDEVLQFLSQNRLETGSNQSTTWGRVLMSRGCGRSWGCSIGPDSGMILVSIMFDEKGKVKSEPIVTARYAGDCS